MNNELIIEHVMQTQDKNCVSACLAMVLDKGISEVTAEFDKDYHAQKTEPWCYLTEEGLNYTHLPAAHRVLKPGYVYMVTVPSMNMEGYLHSIIIQMNDDNTWYIMDPNRGKEGRIVYGAEEGEINVRGWVPYIEIEIESLLAWREKYNG